MSRTSLWRKSPTDGQVGQGGGEGAIGWRERKERGKEQTVAKVSGRGVIVEDRPDQCSGSNPMQQVLLCIVVVLSDIFIVSPKPAAAAITGMATGYPISFRSKRSVKEP